MEEHADDDVSHILWSVASRVIAFIFFEVERLASIALHL